MTAVERVRRTQQVLGAAAIIGAWAWGIAVTLGILAAVSFAALAIPRLRTESSLEALIGIVLGVAVAGFMLWRSRYLVSSGRVALWIEERIPALHYSLITAVEQRGSPLAEPMERAVAQHDVGGVTLAAIRRGLIGGAAALLVAALILYVSPSAAFGRSGSISPFGRAGISASVPVGSRLDDIRVRITPPTYTRQRATTLDDPSSVT